MWAAVDTRGALVVWCVLREHGGGERGSLAGAGAGRAVRPAERAMVGRAAVRAVELRTAPAQAAMPPPRPPLPPSRRARRRWRRQPRSPQPVRSQRPGARSSRARPCCCCVPARSQSGPYPACAAQHFIISIKLEATTIVKYKRSERVLRDSTTSVRSSKMKLNTESAAPVALIQTCIRRLVRSRHSDSTAGPAPQQLTVRRQGHRAHSRRCLHAVARGRATLQQSPRPPGSPGVEGAEEKKIVREGLGLRGRRQLRRRSQPVRWRQQLRCPQLQSPQSPPEEPQLQRCC